MRLFFFVGLLFTALFAYAEVVHVKYRGNVDLAVFDCRNTTSSFVHRVCYDARNSYMVILLGSTYYHYCGIPANAVSAFLSAPSKGRHYNSWIKGSYDCRVTSAPRY